MTFIDSQGNEIPFVVTQSSGFTIRADGVVESFVEDENGREEWTEQLCDSPVREVYPEWIWDLIADPQDGGPSV